MPVDEVMDEVVDVSAWKTGHILLLLEIIIEIVIRYVLSA